LLEWYRTGFDAAQLMAEVDTLVRQLLGAHVSLAASEKLTYREAFLRHANLDPHTATAEDFAHARARMKSTHRPQ